VIAPTLPECCVSGFPARGTTGWQTRSPADPLLLIPVT